MSLAFVPLGVGDAFSRRHYSACVALEADGAWLLVDCPHPIAKMMAESGALDPSKLTGVVVTHLHGDHASGLESLAFFTRLVLGRRLRVAAHPAVLARLWEGHLAGGMELFLEARDRPPVLRALDDYVGTVAPCEEHAVGVGPFSVDCRLTVHHIPTTALRVRAGGRALGLSADTLFDRGLVDWLAEADLVLHEVGFGPHTPLADLRALPGEIRRKLRLIHYPDELDLASADLPALEERRRYEV